MLGGAHGNARGRHPRRHESLRDGRTSDQPRPQHHQQRPCAPALSIAGSVPTSGGAPRRHAMKDAPGNNATMNTVTRPQTTHQPSRSAGVGGRARSRVSPGLIAFAGPARTADKHNHRPWSRSAPRAAGTVCRRSWRRRLPAQRSPSASSGQDPMTAVFGRRLRIERSRSSSPPRPAAPTKSHPDRLDAVAVVKAPPEVNGPAQTLARADVVTDGPLTGPEPPRRFHPASSSRACRRSSSIT